MLGLNGDHEAGTGNEDETKKAMLLILWSQLSSVKKNKKGFGCCTRKSRRGKLWGQEALESTLKNLRSLRNLS